MTSVAIRDTDFIEVGRGRWNETNLSLALHSADQRWLYFLGEWRFTKALALALGRRALDAEVQHGGEAGIEAFNLMHAM